MQTAVVFNAHSAFSGIDSGIWFFSLGTELCETHRGVQAAISLSGLLFEL